jgi:Flp pilus assembly protein CpaB
VTTETVDLAEAPPGALTAVSQAEGRTVRQALTQGDILTDATFGAQDSTAENIKSALGQGFRAMAVQVDQVSGVGTLIRPGDRVDVIISMTESDGKFPVAYEQEPTQSEVDEELLIRNFAPADPNMNNTSIKVLVQNSQVLGTLLPPPPATAAQGQQATPPPDTTEADTEAQLTGQEMIAILALTAQQVELVRFAQIDGNLSLVLRSTADSTAEGEVTPTTGITLRTLVDDHGVIPGNIILQAPPPPLTEQP